MNHSKRSRAMRCHRRLAVAGLSIGMLAAINCVPLRAQTSPIPSETAPTNPESDPSPPPVISPAPTVASPEAKTSVGPRVETIVSMRDKQLMTAAAVAAHKKSYEITLNGSDWLDTGAVVGAGELANFTTSGEITLADGRQTNPDGVSRGWKDLIRQFPMNEANVGALVGKVSKVDATIPFSIGASNKISMPTTGELFLRINTSSDLTFTGEYKVKIKFEDAPKAKATTLATPVSSLITPSDFATVPRRVSDVPSGDGNPGDMVNFALIGTKEEVLAAFKAAGWVAVDKSVQEAIINGLLKTLSREAYTEMPMSTLYLFGRPQDMSFARADPLLVAAERHHLRVWQTEKMIGARPLWVGSATHDIGFEKDQRTGGVTHKIDPEIDKERDYLLQSFDAAGDFSSAAYVTPVNPLIDAKTATGGSFQSDGRIAVMDLK